MALSDLEHFVNKCFEEQTNHDIIDAGGMRDIDVRLALRGWVANQFRAEPGTLIIEELGILNGHYRIDLGVVNGMLHGYEIKSDADTLERLPSQCSAYGGVFDRLFLVVGPRHLERAEELVPHWWGILEAAHDDDSRVGLRERRGAQANPGVNAIAVARLLWKNELIMLLEECGLKGVRSKPLPQLHRMIAETMALEALKQKTRDVIKQRPEHWRPDARRT